MSSGTSTVIYPVRDLPRAKTLFTALFGAEPVMDTPYYVGFRVADQDIGLDPNGHRGQGMSGPVVYWEVDDIKASLEALLDSGASPQEQIKDVGGGKLIATVSDADGNPIGITQSA